MLNRRDLLKLSGSAALLAGCGNDLMGLEAPNAPGATAGSLSVKNPALLPLDSAFPIGVMAGDATPQSVILWTRFDGSNPVRLQVWEDTGQNMVRLSYDAPVTFKNGFALVDVTGLDPNKAYRYGFVVNQASRSAIGNFRTSFAEDTYAPLTFAGTSCTHQRRWPYPVLSRAALQNDIAFFVHNGDHVYCDGAVSLDNYRKRYAQTYEQIGMQALHQAFNWYGTWDDHEVDDNWDQETIDPKILEAATQTFYEHTPIRQYKPGRMWRSFQWGRTAEVFMLDCRSERKPSTRKTRDATYISREQMDWLKQGLVTSKAQFKFIINSVPMGHFGGLWQVKADDRWEGYAAQREDLLDFMVGEHMRGTYFLSGDFHCGFAGRIEKEGPYSGIREIVWGPGGQRPNPLYVTLDPPQWDFTTGENNFAVIKADPGADALSVDFINENGGIINSVTYRNG